MRKNSLARQARRAYDQGELTRILTLREDRFGRAFGMQTVSIGRDFPTGRKSYRYYDGGRPEDYYHFRDNGSSVLAVAHLDTVVPQKGRVPRFRDTERGPLVVSGALDDRLGAYVIIGLLPKLGVTCDWLFTVGEESGQSTAESFDARGKKYDWVIEFDRGGTDVVMYQYEDRASRRLVEASGARMGQGSFSDIAYLDHLGVKAFNWGVGYGGNYHSADGYAYLNDTFSIVAKYLRFHEQNAGTALPHEESRSYGSGSLKTGYGSFGRYDDDDGDYYGDCATCGEKAVVDSVTWYCTVCGICQDCGATDPDIAAEWNDPDADVCQCYAPKQRGIGEPGDQDWRAMSWDEYCQLRPAAADDAALKDAWQKAQDRDGPGTLVQAGLITRESARRARAYEDGEPDTKSDSGSRISAAPPWSEHRPGYGLGVPVSRKTGATQAAGLSEDLVAAVTAIRDASDRAHGYSAVNPPAVFPDADQGWHEATTKGIFVIAHEPGQAWAKVCLRCAARWPHPVGSTDIHPEADCPGCNRCSPRKTRRPATIHVIPAHLAGDSDLCGLCQDEADALSELDRGDGVRENLRALDEQEAGNAQA